ncbi:MAG: trimethylamine methyltransferase family protein, partial [Gammaproteobacteria bacterium]|nr:trimethylamine methyltransferase family protein [Gammaproteobacteria bacterium]
MSEIESSSPRRGTGRRRPAAANAPAPAPERSRAYRHLVNPFDHPRIYSDDQVAAIHVAALTLLENQGMKVLSPIARKRYAQAGATVDEYSQVVRIDRGLVAKALATTPSEFTFQALDPEFNVQVGGKHVC